MKKERKTELKRTKKTNQRLHLSYLPFNLLTYLGKFAPKIFK